MFFSLFLRTTARYYHKKIVQKMASLKIFVSTPDTQEKLNEAMARYQLLDYRSRLGNLVKALLPAVRSELKAKSAVSTESK